MGKEKTRTQTDSTTQTTASGTQAQSQQYTPTAEETRLNQLEVARTEATQPGLIASQQAGLDLVKLLLQGSENLPGFFQNLQSGISPDVTSSIVQESLADITPQFAQSGLLDSGVRAVVGGRIAGDIRRGAEEFNIGNRLNLLNQAIGGQAQVQQPILGQAANLGNRLAGLRSMSATGSFSNIGSSSERGSSTVYGMNPFMKSFQTNYGAWLGGGAQKAAMGGGG